jgi:hypothetical protein
LFTITIRNIQVNISRHVTPIIQGLKGCLTLAANIALRVLSQNEKPRPRFILGHSLVPDNVNHNFHGFDRITFLATRDRGEPLRGGSTHVVILDKLVFMVESVTVNAFSAERAWGYV